MGWKMGVLVGHMPKCHCVLAREGIEYSWGCTKIFYRRLPLKEKKSKEMFKQSVRKSLCNKNVLMLDRIRAFSRRARQYTLAYYALRQQQQEQQAIGKQAAENLATSEASQLTTVKIESVALSILTVPLSSRSLLKKRLNNYYYYYYYFWCWHRLHWSELNN